MTPSLVALSIAVLLAAPLLAAALLRRPALAAGLDGFVLVAVGGIVALHVVPQSVAIAGPMAIALAAAGLFLPIALHRLDDAALARGPARRARDAVLFVVFFAGVVVHALFDGAALAQPAPAASSGFAVDALALGVILHRVPVGIALWVVARPKLGAPRTLLVMATYAGGTVAGALLGPGLLVHASAPALAIFQAFVAGSILHIVAESPALPLPRVRPAPLLLLRAPALRAPPPSTTIRLAGLIGSVLAVAALWAMEHAHAEEHADGVGFVDAFVRLSYLVAPAAALSFLVVGMLFVIYPDRVPLRRRPRGALLDATRGALAGLPHPLCSCAVAPLYDELVDDGAAPASARAFLVAAPSLGVPAIFVSARLLGLPFTATRVLGAALVAIAAGLSARASRAAAEGALDIETVDGAVRDAANGASETSGPAPLAFAQRVLPGLRHGVVDAVDHVGPWLLLGTAIAAAIEVSIDVGALSAIAPINQVAVASLVALPLYLCAAGATPVAFALLGKGASTGAVLALLLVGPTTSLPTLGLLRRRHGTAASLAFAVAVVLAAVLVGSAVDALAPLGSAVGAVAAAGAVGAAGAGGPSLIDVVALVIVIALLAASFVRQGVRGFLVQVMSPQHAHAGDDVHGPNCAHDHGPAVVAAPLARVTLPFDPRGRP